MLELSQLWGEVPIPDQHNNESSERISIDPEQDEQVKEKKLYV